VFRRGYARITTRGFPHSEIRGSKVVQHLTAAYRSRPRPSSASDAKASTACPSYLDVEHTYCRYAVFKVRDRPPQMRRPLEDEVPARTPLGPRRDPSRLNSTAPGPAPRAPRTPGSEWVRADGARCARSSTFVLGLGSLGSRRGSSTATSRAPEPWWCSAPLPRKEVIQPQLPLRLPCYDFTPIADPTFDGCPPCGLAHRLRVLPTFVV